MYYRFVFKAWYTLQQHSTLHNLQTILSHMSESNPHFWVADQVWGKRPVRYNWYRGARVAALHPSNEWVACRHWRQKLTMHQPGHCLLSSKLHILQLPLETCVITWTVLWKGSWVLSRDFQGGHWLANVMIAQCTLIEALFQPREEIGLAVLYLIWGAPHCCLAYH